MAVSGNGQRYEVHCSGAVAKSIRRLQESASPAQRKRIALAFRGIVERLRVAADQLGEPLYRLPTLRMQVRTVVVPPLAVVFGVCEDRPLVFIRRGRLLREF
jgi:hypothetical protein